MRVREFCESLNMRVIAGESSLDKELTGMYAGDLLSWVMSHACKGDAWITVHTHLNVVAVAVLTEISCIIIPDGIAVEEATIKRANQEGIVILGTDLSVYDICWKTHRLIGG